MADPLPFSLPAYESLEPDYQSTRDNGSLAEKLNFLVDRVQAIDAKISPLAKLYDESVTYAKVVSGLIGIVVFLAGVGDAIFWFFRHLAIK